MIVASAFIVVLYIVARAVAHALRVVHVRNSQILFSGFALLDAVSDVKQKFPELNAHIFFFVFVFEVRIFFHH